MDIKLIKTNEKVLEIVDLLRKNEDFKRAEHDQYYFKEKVNSFGVSNPITRKLANEYYSNNKNLNLDNVLKICESLLKINNLNTDTFAMQLLSKFKKDLKREHFYLFEKWIDKYVNNWATCDDLSNHYIGYLLEKEKSLTKEIINWTKSKKRWKRRSACVSFIIPAKKGLYLEIIFRVSKTLVYDKDDMVQKGNGWMLKDASILHKKEVLSFLKNYKDAPRTFLRYALERCNKIEKEMILK
jgi:3-methyladenine DNA glycosylase AlkD